MAATMMENGVNGHLEQELNGSRPRTPSLKNSLSLTEYSTNPSPLNGTPRSKLRDVVPEEFILPNGYPDVCFRTDFSIE
jgi:threonine dehydratase